MFGWKPRECLDMLAKTFFAVTESSSRLKLQERNSFLYDMIDVASCAQASDAKWIDTLKAHFVSRIESLEPEVMKKPIRKTKLELDMAAKSLMEALKIKKRLEHHV